MEGETSVILKRVANTPIIMQLEALECGAASLAMVDVTFNCLISSFFMLQYISNLSHS